MDTRVAEVTVKVVESTTLPRVALMTDAPALTADARPSEPAALEMVATTGVAELQVTLVVRF